MSKERMPPGVVTAIYERAGVGCEAMIPLAGCTFRGEHLHHRLMRSQGGQHTVENLIRICHRCHHFIHMNPAWSYERGLLVRSTDIPTWPPAYYRGLFRGRRDTAYAEDQDD